MGICDAKEVNLHPLQHTGSNAVSMRNALAAHLGEEVADYLVSPRSLFNDLSDPQLARLVRRMMAEWG